MTTESQLLAEIRAHPDDDGRRLVLADHWTECGDPRGEFVATQIELARATTPKDWSRYIACSERSHELLRQHERAWIATFGPPDLHVRWERGLVDHVWLSTLEPVTVKPYLFEQPIRTLGLAAFGAPRDNFEAACALPWPASLRDLELSSYQPGDDMIATIAPLLPRLRSLALKDDFTDAAIDAVVLAAPHLDGFELQATKVTRRGLDRLLSALRLRRFAVRRADPAGVAEAIASAPQVSALETLTIDQAIGPAGIAALAGAALTGLRELELSHAEIADGFGAIAGASALRNVRRLMLWGERQLGPAAMQALARSPLAALAELVVLGGSIGDEGAAALAASDALTSLEELHLGDCRIRSEGALALARSRLSALGLSDNWLGNLGTRAAELAREGRAVLHLDGTYLDDLAVESLARAPEAADLRYLGLRLCSFGTRGARALLESPYLDSICKLDLEQIRMDDHVRAALRERFGNRVNAVFHDD